MNLEPLQEQLGYRFVRGELLLEAMTHASTIGRRGSMVDVPCYERLEFLGDAVLGLVTSEFLMTGLPDATEGEMSRTRSRIICEENLASATRRMNIGHYLQISHGEDKSGGRNRDSLLADVFEAIAAAIYLDGGLESARLFIQRNLLSMESGALQLRSSTDYKTTLQELIQGMKLPIPSYEVVDAVGPSHAPVFTVAVSSEGRELGRGEGRTKKEASQVAAMHAIAAMSSNAAIAAGEK